MKRSREEEKGEGQQQEPTQGAAMAATTAPNRNRNRRGPAAAVAATPSETGERRVLMTRIFDAADFVTNVRDEFEPEKYQQFLHAVCQVFMGIGTAAVVDSMKPLFRGHPTLTRQLNRFLPTRYKLSEDDDQLPEEVPDVYSLQGSPPPPSVD